MKWGELEGEGERGEADLGVLDPEDPDTQVGIQAFLAHLPAVLKVLTPQGPGQRTPRHMSQADDRRVVKTGPDYSTSGPSRKTLTGGGDMSFHEGTHVQA